MLEQLRESLGEVEGFRVRSFQQDDGDSLEYTNDEVLLIALKLHKAGRRYAKNFLTTARNHGFYAVLYINAGMY